MRCLFSTLLLALLTPTLALAQGEEPSLPEPPAATAAEEEPLAGADAPLEADASDTTAPAEVAPEAASEGSAEDCDDPLDAIAAILSNVEVMAFADVYLANHWTLPEGFSADHSADIGHRAFDVMGGPALSFLGLDVSYDAHPFSATIAIRFGSSMPRLMGPTSGLPDGLQFLKQVFVSFTPIAELRVDFGLFDTPFGAEVSESWRNPTYTRGALFNVLQPFYHSGLRAVWTPTEQLTVTALAVNGWNTFIDNNDGKSVGLQVAYAEGPISASVGYLGGPETADDSRWRHFVDVIGRLTGDIAELTVNADFLAEDVGMGAYDLSWGMMATAHFQLVSDWAVAVRGEYLGDPDTGSGLGTATLTVDWTASSNVVVRLDNRVDAATDMRFVDPQRQPTSFVASSVLGLVVHTD